MELRGKLPGLNYTPKLRIRLYLIMLIWEEDFAQYKRVVQGKQGRICEIVLNVHRTNDDEV